MGCLMPAPRRACRAGRAKKRQPQDQAPVHKTLVRSHFPFASEIDGDLSPRVKNGCDVVIQPAAAIRPSHSGRVPGLE